MLQSLGLSKQSLRFGALCCSRVTWFKQFYGHNPLVIGQGA